MVDAGIDDGDILVVNRALVPAHRNIVVAQVGVIVSFRQSLRRGSTRVDHSIGFRARD